MTKLYDTHPYLKQFVAEVTDIIEQGSAYHIVLDETAFYPTGGGQPCDMGMIEDCPIHDVYEKDGIIYHVSNKKPIKIHKVKGEINWQRRFDHMQQHATQHLLSALLLEQHTVQTLSFHLGQDTCSLEINKVLDKNVLETLFEEANKLIEAARPISTFYPTKQELKKLKLRNLPTKAKDNIRLVQIEDLTIDACCGTHPQNTLELMHCKLLKTEKLKTGSKLYFVAGFREYF